MTTSPSTSTALEHELARVPNRAQAERFLERAKAISRAQWQQVEMDYDKPRLGRETIWRRTSIAGLTYEALGREFNLVDRVWGRTEYGPGLQPLAEAFMAVGFWGHSIDPRDFVCLYAPFLKQIALDAIGFAEEVSELARPEVHQPLVHAYEQILLTQRGRLASPASALPDSARKIELAVCFAAALDPDRAGTLSDELVELCAFVADADAELVNRDDRHGQLINGPDRRQVQEIIDRIRTAETTTLEWLGLDEALDDAKKELGGSGVRIGFAVANKYKSESDFLFWIYVSFYPVLIAGAVLFFSSLSRWPVLLLASLAVAVLLGGGFLAKPLYRRLEQPIAAGNRGRLQGRLAVVAATILPSVALLGAGLAVRLLSG